MIPSPFCRVATFKAEAADTRQHFGYRPRPAAADAATPLIERVDDAATPNIERADK